MKFTQSARSLVYVGLILLTCQSCTFSGQTDTPLSVEIHSSLSEQETELSRQRTNLNKQAEAAEVIRAINRAELSFFTQKSRFTTSLDELELAIEPEAQNYRYRIFLFQRPRVNDPNLKKAAWSVAISKKPELKSYVGIVGLRAMDLISPDVITNFAILCESEQPTMELPPAPTFKPTKDEEANCPQGFIGIQNVTNHGTSSSPHF